MNAPEKNVLKVRHSYAPLPLGRFRFGQRSILCEISYKRALTGVCFVCRLKVVVLKSCFGAEVGQCFGTNWFRVYLFNSNQAFCATHRRNQGGYGQPRLLVYLVILCFERRRPKQKYCCSPEVKHYNFKILGRLPYCVRVLLLQRSKLTIFPVSRVAFLWARGCLKDCVLFWFEIMRYVVCGWQFLHLCRW